MPNLLRKRKPLTNQVDTKGEQMISLALVLAAMVAIFAGSLPILALAIAGLAIKIYPLAALAVFAAVTAWAINQFWRR
jgi:hypothetical protein